jgi:hypothetical protein
VIVVDNAPATGAAEDVARRTGARYVRELRPGLDWARNRGIREARHHLLAFTDDDVRVDRGWLGAIARGFAEPGVGLVTGLVAPGELETSAQLAFEYRYGGMGKGCTPRTFDRDRLGPAGLIAAHQVGVGANMAFRRTVFDRIGGFDTGLDVGTPARGGGDLDMFHRVLGAGARARYEPAALVWHHHRREAPALERQLRDNGRSFCVYLLTQWVAAGRRPGAVPRRAIARYGLLTWGGWLTGRVLRRLAQADAPPLRLQRAELLGVVAGPWATLATRRSDRRVRAAAG